MLMPSVARSIALLMCTFALFSSDRSAAQGPNFVNDPFAAATPPGEEVVAELVSEVSAVQPGTTFTVALKMAHSGPWHTYWENPGTGRPTQLNWTLPDRFYNAILLLPISTCNRQNSWRINFARNWPPSFWS